MNIPEDEEFCNYKGVIWHMKGIINMPEGNVDSRRMIHLFTTDASKVNCEGCLGIMREREKVSDEVRSM